jgi:hypothetical protein
MKQLLWVVVLAVMPVFALPAEAQLFFKKARPIPAQRVPELILTLKTETDERKRAAAAEELRDYDAKTFTEIIPVLIDVLHNDKKTGVRLEALNSLYRLRPVSQAAGQAIEYTSANDESLRVRLQAKSTLLKYHIAGYSSSGKSEPTPFQPTTQEPPLADPPGLPIPAVVFPPVPTKAGQPVTSTPNSPTDDVPRPLPQGVVLPTGQAPRPQVIQIEGPSPARPF